MANEPEPERGRPAVELFSVSKTYPRSTSPALTAVDLQIASGEFFTVLGPSGSGKSTMLSLLAGFERASEGRIAIAGRDVTNVPSNRRNVGMVFQDYALFPHMDVFGNVYFPLKARKFDETRGECERRVQRVLDTVGLTGFERRMPAQLSGGEQQRVALARALVYEPAVLLMDESLAALDRKLRKQMQAELVSLHHALSTTIIFVTHDQDEALHLSDRIAILDRGKVQQIGTPNELYGNPDSLFVAGFIGDANIFPGKATPDGIMLDDFGIHIPALHGLPTGDQASLVVRPESVELDPSGSGGKSELVGTVAFTSFRGSHVEVHIELANGVSATALIPPHRGVNVPAGTSVRVAWNVDKQQVVAGSNRPGRNSPAVPDPGGADHHTMKPKEIRCQ